MAEVHGKAVPEEGKLRREISRKFLFSEVPSSVINHQSSIIHQCVWMIVTGDPLFFVFNFLRLYSNYIYF